MRSNPACTAGQLTLLGTRQPRASAILAVVLLAACDGEPVVAPPAAVVSDSESRTGLSAAAASDRDILIALYEATNGPNWLNSENWLTDGPLGEWYGVDTDASGRVIRMDLAGSWDSEASRWVRHGLAGPIPEELGGLAKLEILDLGNNQLTGLTPDELGGLANLETLDLGNNELTGPIPEELGGLANLETLILRINGLTGPIPEELGGLAKLEILDLELNELTGPIPVELSGLANLETLTLHANQLSGSIPAELGNLADLGTLWLASNQFTGPIPPELGNLTNLWQLSLAENALSGTIPLSFQQLLELQTFQFENNAGLCLGDALVAWYEAIEHTDGPICPDREVLRLLYEAAGGRGWTNADGWLGDGRLAEWYGVDVDSSGLVATVDLEGNALSGGLPDSIGHLAGLTTLRIGDNALSGRLPHSLRRTPLQELRYANTALCVPVEVWFREWLAAIPQHEGTGTQCLPLTDREILAVLHAATGGPSWENSDNWLTDAPLGEWHGVTVDADDRVTSLDLRRNGLEGPIHPALGGLAELETLILFDNRLTGSIPPELGGLAKAKLVVLAANRLSGPIPPELSRLAAVNELFLNDNELTSVPAEIGQLGNLQALSLDFNRLTSVPAELGGLAKLEYLGLWSNELTSIPAELGELGNLRELDLDLNRLTSVPKELGRLASLQFLWLCCNKLASIPTELGELAEVRMLFLEGNRLTTFPLGAGGYPSLRILDLSSNEFVSLPLELGELGSLRVLALEGNRLADAELGAGGFDSLQVLDLSSNELTSFPRGLGELGNLRQLELDGNRLTDVPSGLGGVADAERVSSYSPELPSVPRRLSEFDAPWRLDPDGNRLTLVSRKLGESGALRTQMGLDGNRSVDARPRAGAFASLEILDLSSNELSGSLPAGLVEFTGLTSLGLADNAGLAGALPLDLTALEGLEDLHTTGTELCAPADPAFLDWLEGVTRQRVALCRRGDAAAYLTQAVQSREFPVPLVAGESALLRVFLTTDRATEAGIPPVRVTFFRDGVVTHEMEIPAKSDPILAAIDESSLSKSANAEIPGWVIQPGLEIVIEPDPRGTLDRALGVARRIPPTGRMAVDVRSMPVFEVTVVPFLWEERPDSTILGIGTAMADDPEGHELFERTRLLLPVSAMDVRAHEPVRTSTNNGFEILEQTEMIRVMESGRGHYLGVMAGPTGPGGLLGVAYDIGSWSNFSVLDSETIAHEFGHNRNLYHAPCGGAGGPDRYYPYGEGNIGAWGYDRGTGDLVPPTQRDYMSYCEPTWTSDYQFTNAVRYRLETENNSILVATADTRTAASSGRSLLVWGGLDGEGVPHLRPAFFIDAPPAPPSSGGAWSLTGRGPGGAELFSMSFAMAEFTDTEDDRAGFTFALPVTWTEELAGIALQGPRGSASLDRDTDDPLTILRDEATGQVRGILDGLPPAGPDLDSTLAAAGQGLEILFSRGIPSAVNERR